MAPRRALGRGVRAGVGAGPGAFDVRKQKVNSHITSRNTVSGVSVCLKNFKKHSRTKSIAVHRFRGIHPAVPGPNTHQSRRR